MQASYSRCSLIPGCCPWQSIAAFTRWCAQEGRDAADRQTRAEYGALLAQQGKTRPWPPDRNDPCWCGSERKVEPGPHLVR